MSTFSEAIITEIQIRGFRSLENVTVMPQPVTVLVGPNTSGKSSFVDALFFLKRALADSPQKAFEERGGVEQIQTKTGQRPKTIELKVAIKSRAEGLFAGSYRVRFRVIGSGKKYSIPFESGEMMIKGEQTPHRFLVAHGRWEMSVAGTTPPIASNRLALPLLSGLEYFAPLYSALTSLYYYAINPQVVGTLQKHSYGERLTFDGSNAASVLRQLKARDKTLYQNVVQAVCHVIPTIQTVTDRKRGDRLTIAFEEKFPNLKPVSFDAGSMSAGTLRILAILLAVYQSNAPTLVTLEEPETAIHPGAAAVLVDAFKEAGLRLQILITTHSPDLLDRFEVDDLLAVSRIRGVTNIAPITESQRLAIRDRLFTAGEIHRLEGLRSSGLDIQETNFYA